MGAVQQSSSLWMSRSRHFVETIFLCIVTLLLDSTIPAVASHGVGYGAMKAELFHREHPFSGLQSTTPLGYAEKLQNDGKRSADRVKALVTRRILSQDSVAADTTRASTTLKSTVSDASDAEHVMTISLGTPPQTFVAVADTASDLTWLQCKPCQACFEQPDPVFDPALSSTYQTLNCSSMACSYLALPPCDSSVPTCQYTYMYNDMSNTSGTFSSETINLKSISGHNITVPDFWFGCSHASFSPSALYDSSDGLVGLGQGKVSFPSQLGGLFEDKFSYCLVNRSVAGVQSSPLLFGRDSVPDLELQFTPILCNEYYPSYYYVSLEGISVGGAAVNFNSSAIAIDSFGSGGTIIDSGTTYTVLDPVAFTPLLASIESKFPSSYQRVVLPEELSYLELCYNVTGNPNYGDDLPDISLKFANDTSWDLEPHNTWLLLLDFPETGTISICISILRGMHGSFSIIGNTQQLDFHVVYDRVDKRIGFAKTDCGSV